MSVITLMDPGSRSFDSGSKVQPNRAKALYIMVEVTAIVDTPSVTPTIRLKSPFMPTPNFEFIRIWTAAAPITGVGTYIYYFVDHKSPTAATFDVTETAELRLYDDWQIYMVTANNDSMTYSASYMAAVN